MVATPAFLPKVFMSGDSCREHKTGIMLMFVVFIVVVLIIAFKSRQSLGPYDSPYIKTM